MASGDAFAAVLAKVGCAIGHCDAPFAALTDATATLPDLSATGADRSDDPSGRDMAFCDQHVETAITNGADTLILAVLIPSHTPLSVGRVMQPPQDAPEPKAHPRGISFLAPLVAADLGGADLGSAASAQPPPAAALGANPADVIVPARPHVSALVAVPGQRDWPIVATPVAETQAQPTAADGTRTSAAPAPVPAPPPVPQPVAGPEAQPLPHPPATRPDPPALAATGPKTHPQTAPPMDARLGKTGSNAPVSQDQGHPVLSDRQPAMDNPPEAPTVGRTNLATAFGAAAPSRFLSEGQQITAGAAKSGADHVDGLTIGSTDGSADGPSDGLADPVVAAAAPAPASGPYAGLPRQTAFVAAWATATTPPDQHDTLPEATRAILRQIAPAVPGRDGTVEITLFPKGLGQVRLDIQQGPVAAMITVFADRPETLDLIRRHATELVTELRVAGIANPVVNFAPHDTAPTGHSPQRADPAMPAGGFADGTAGSSSQNAGGSSREQPALRPTPPVDRLAEQSDATPPPYRSDAVPRGGMILRL